MTILTIQRPNNFENAELNAGTLFNFPHIFIDLLACLYNSLLKLFSFIYFTLSGQALDDPEITEGDIAVYTGFQNADPCTARGCKWPRSQDGFVYVPYYISDQYCKAHFSLCSYHAYFKGTVINSGCIHLMSNVANHHSL